MAPQHPAALKLWRSEIKRAAENFEDEAWNLVEQLREKNRGVNPEMYKLNGKVSFLFLLFAHFCEILIGLPSLFFFNIFFLSFQYPDTHVHWLISSGYIDAEGNTLRKIPHFDQWVNEAAVKREKEAADRLAAAEAGVEYVPPPKPVVPEQFKPFSTDPYFHLPPGLDKMYMPHGTLLSQKF